MNPLLAVQPMGYVRTFFTGALYGAGAAVLVSGATVIYKLVVR